MPKLAIKDFNKALSLGYDNRDLYLYRGLSYIVLNKHTEAEIDLAKYLSLAQDSDLNRPQALLELSKIWRVFFTPFFFGVYLRVPPTGTFCKLEAPISLCPNSSRRKNIPENPTQT